MELTKSEKLVLTSMVTNCLGVEALIELCGKETVSKLDTLSDDLVGNTTPNEMGQIVPSVVKKLVDSILDDEQPKQLNETAISIGIANSRNAKDIANALSDFPTRLKGSE